MTTKKIPFDSEKLQNIVSRYPTPFHIYDESAIRENARRFIQAFSWHPQFKQYFAVKACPNPHIVKILHQEGFGIDCSSLAELLIAEKCGLQGEEIFFSSNDTPGEEFVKARQLDAIINLDDISHIPFLNDHAGMPELICFRYNPGPLRGGNAIIGNPIEAKYGFTREQIFQGLQQAKEMGVTRFGLHTMVISNELNADSFVETAEMMFSLAVEVKEKIGISIELINLGGGIGIPYKPEEKPVDFEYVAAQIKEKYASLILAKGMEIPKLCTESGRMVTGPFGYLVTKVRHLKHTYKDYVGCDACMANLMRPALYDAYHHITVMGKENDPAEHTYDVTGSLCENNDKFAIDRQLPEVAVGDLLVIHDAGAHGHAMGFNYNGKLRSAELLLKEDGEVQQIRRAETIEDYFATLDFSHLG